jgi:hypothetical protein
MEGLSAVYKDLEEVRKLEESRRRQSKKKGITVLCAPEKHDKTKFIYSGLCSKQGDKIIQMFPDFESLGILEGKVRKILLKPLNKRKLGEFEYYKISEL